MNQSENPFVKNLKILMKDNKINRVELAKELNIAYTTLCDWCTGRITPRYEKIQMIADFFKVDIGALVSENFKDPDDDITNEIFEVTIAKEILWGFTPAFCMKQLRWFRVPLSNDKVNPKLNYFGLRMNDNSMKPELNKNDYCIFVETNKVDTDGIYCIRVPEESATIRKIVKLKGGMVVIPVNDDSEYITETYKDTDIGTKIEILGKCTVLSKSVNNDDED